MTLDEQFAYLIKGCVDVVRGDELRKKLERSAQTGKPLVVKVGFDPTAPDLHLGHTVLIRKMKHFQDLGHTVVFLIGDFTGLIGDPTGRSKTRPALTREEIDQNAETYKTQVFKLLDSQKTVVDFNSRWLVELGSEGWVRLAARYNVAQMLERRDFKQRYEKGQPIAIHEFLYPLAQAYDSVRLKADVELGGTDQLFNLNVGRDIMPGYGLEPQIVMTTPLLVGLDGVEKMSKSAGNYVGIMEAPSEIFGKVMSISDELMWTYYELLTDVKEEQILVLKDAAAREAAAALEGLKQAGPGKKPPKITGRFVEDALAGLRDALALPELQAGDSGERRPGQMKAKLLLAELIVRDFHGRAAALSAREAFERRFARKELPTDVPERDLSYAESPRVATLLVDLGLAPSSSAATRLIDQGGVRIDGDRVADKFERLAPERRSFILEVGRKAVRVTLRSAGGR